LPDGADLEPHQFLSSQFCTLGQVLLILVYQVFGESLAVEQFIYPLVALVFENSPLVIQILEQLFFFSALDAERSLVLLCPFSCKSLDVDDSAVDSRRASQTRIADIASFLAEDRTQKFLFGC